MTAREIKTNTFAVMGVFLLAGVVMMVFGIYWLLQTRRFLSEAQLTSGVVVDLKLISGPGIHFRPVFRFNDTNGVIHIVDELVGSSSSPLSVGQTVAVAYPLHEPMKARINSFGTLWVFPVFIASMGSLFVLVTGIGFALVLFGGPRHKPWVTQ